MKEKKKFNVVDGIIIACVLLIVAAVVFRARIVEFIASGQNLSEYTIAFESEPVGNSYAGYITPGKSIEWVEKNDVIGTIASIESTKPAEMYTVCSDGKLLITESDSEYVIHGTLSVKAADKDGCFVSGTEFVGAGMEMTLRSNNTVFTVTVLSVTRK